MTRKLASLQKIVSLSPIAGADNIELATVLGWQCVVKRGEFKVGDLAVYFEVDSILPDKAEFEFLRSRKFRIKTIKLRGVISQGLVMPLSVLPTTFHLYIASEGMDVTDTLGVTKYDPEAEIESQETSSSKSWFTKFMMKYGWYRKLFGRKNLKGGWPSFIPHTDEDRIQLFPNICTAEYLTEFIVTEKLDGQSSTFFLKRNKGNILNPFTFGVCSRKVYLKNEDNSNYWNIARKYNIRSVLGRLIGNNDFVILQGEIIGDGIQGNKYGLKDVDFYAFNLIYPTGKLDSVQIKNTLDSYGIKTVPILSNSFFLPLTIQECVDVSVGKSNLKDTPREGIVVRNNERGISFKIINPEFLIEHGL